jgi:16S rRNA (uracil1498-N3)-methyltransferase
MRLTRVFLDQPLHAGERITLPSAQSQHLSQVLRVRSGQPIVLFNGDGRDYPAQIVRLDRAGVTAEVGRPGQAEPPARLRVRLGLGVSKGERMDFALQKSTELGATRITPLFTARSVIRLGGDRLARRRQHWRGVVTAACEQSGRRRLAELTAPEPLDAWLASDHPRPVVLDHRGAISLTSLPAPDGELTLLVGPEGGLEPAEHALARAKGFTPVRLGPRILRTETAPLVALAVAQALWGDL